MHQTVLHFWFVEVSPAQRWKADPKFDELIADRFGALHKKALRAELYDWRCEAHGRLAEIIVLDQFSRNLYRSDPRSFAADPMALALAQEAVALKADLELSAEERVFLYMPFMHSESPLIHETAERLFRENGIQNNYDFELKHKAIVDRFGRYPHRNAVLSRQSTADELEFLQQPGSSF
jgi:uncharacterized protein (DUF924 family)